MIMSWIDQTKQSVEQLAPDEVRALRPWRTMRRAGSIGSTSKHSPSIAPAGRGHCNPARAGVGWSWIGAHDGYDRLTR